MSAKTKALLRKRRQYLNDEKEFNEITKQMRKSRREDTKARMMERIHEKLDERDIWMGIRTLHEGYKITPYGKKRKNEERIPFEEQAEKSAKYLAEVHWKNQITTNGKTYLTTKS